VDAKVRPGVECRSARVAQDLHRTADIDVRRTRCVTSVSLTLEGTELAMERYQEKTMSLVRLLGFTTLSCGCVVGRYRELATNREVAYVEEKGQTCDAHGHRRNHTIQTHRITAYSPELASAKAC
jgi:hypothetical protein